MITNKQVKKIAELSYLNLNDKEIERNSKELSKIIDFIEILKGINTDHVEPLLNTTNLEDVMREDKAKSSGKGDDIIKTAPESQKKYIKTKSFSNI